MRDLIESKIPTSIKVWLGGHLSRDFLNLVRGLPSRWRNVEYNKTLWDGYAKAWNKKHIPFGNADLGKDERSGYMTHLGDEWGRQSDVDKIVEDYIYPYITYDSCVAEIGVGGGRIASRVAGNVKRLYALDISKEMLRKARTALADNTNVSFILLHNPSLPDTLTGKCDFIYSFDVFVHLDLHTMWKYFVEIHQALKNGGRAFIHTSNIKAPGGWDWFSSQDAFSVDTHYPISPEIIEILAKHSGLTITKSSSPDPTNLYLNRDYLFIVEKGT